MKRKSVSVEPEKVHRLTLAELAAHDDACSDAMIDNAYFKSQIRKNKTKYFPMRIKEDEVPQILLHKVIVQKDMDAAEKDLLRMPSLKRYRASLKSKAEQENFLKHLRKYIYMYQTDCAWEVSTTNRYTITTYEAAVTARQRIKQGQNIKYLVGTLVPLTMEESADLDHTNRNFSIVVSSRKKNSSIFLGPARFANHDCDANGRLVFKGSDAMEVIAMKNIEIGDEITVSYGDDYFGPGNTDCLCHTCERLVRNGWAGGADVSESSRESVASSQEPGSPNLTSNKRKRDASSGLSDSTSMQPSKRAKPKHSPSKLQQSWTPTSSINSEVAEPLQDTAAVEVAEPIDRPSIMHNETTLSPPASPIDLLTTSMESESKSDEPEENYAGVRRISTRRQSSSQSRSANEPKINKTTARLLGSDPTTRQHPLSPASTAASSIDSRISADTSQQSDNITIKVESVEVNRLETDNTIILNRDQQHGMPSPVTDEECQQPTAITTLTTIEVSKTVPTLAIDSSTIIPSIEPNALTSTTTTTTTQITVKPLSDRVRVPGDYSLTRKLLAQPHDRWVQCLNDRCQGFFVQPNGYQTRRECPRCERHSMLYGFSWPKTDPDPRKLFERSPGGRKGKGKPERTAFRRAGKCGKGSWYEGGGDEEERVMDHRIVHRFVLPEDEKTITRRGLLREAEEARLSRQEFDPQELHIGRKRTESVGIGGRADSIGERGSLTPDGEARRRSNRFVTRIGLYAD